MANVYSATFLVSSIKRRGLIPTGQTTFTDAELLLIANEEVQTYIVPILSGVRERYGLTTTTQAYTAGTADYDIPTRAVGSNPERVLKLDSDRYVPLDRIEPSRENDFGATGDPVGYLLKGNKVQLIPNPSAGGTIKFEFFERPNRVVALTEVAEVATAAAVGATSVTVSSTVPATYTTSVTYDFVQGTPHFNTTARDLTPSAVSGTTWSYASGLPVALAKGDYICLANESPIPQVPVELHSVLAQRVAYRVFESLGNVAKAGQLEGQASKMAEKAKSLLAPRSDGSPRVIINRNGPGWGRRSWRRS